MAFSGNGEIGSVVTDKWGETNECGERGRVKNTQRGSERDGMSAACKMVAERVENDKGDSCEVLKAFLVKARARSYRPNPWGRINVP